MPGKGDRHEFSVGLCSQDLIRTSVSWSPALNLDNELLSAVCTRVLLLCNSCTVVSQIFLINNASSSLASRSLSYDPVPKSEACKEPVITGQFFCYLAICVCIPSHSLLPFSCHCPQKKKKKLKYCTEKGKKIYIFPS